jgi:hypothetical protein
MMTTEIPESPHSNPPLGLGLSEGLGVTRADFECEWTPTEKDKTLHELAKRYHDETESYDRTVCTGPIVRGSIQAANSRELALINRNARPVFDRIAREAASHGISKIELWHAVGRHA